MRRRNEGLTRLKKTAELKNYSIQCGRTTRPIRIVVDNGHVTLVGAVNSAMDKQIAGMRAGQLFGAFSVENKLEVVKG